MNPMLLADGYKLDHRRQVPSGATLMFNNLTPRSGKYRPGNTGKIVFAGLQYYILKYLIDYWNEEFFFRKKSRVIEEFTKHVNSYLGPDNQVGVEHIKALHNLQYLPISIWALPEGSRVPYKVAPLVSYNTHPDFYWVTNYLETLMSCTLWPICTAATTAYDLRKVYDEYSLLTVGHTLANKYLGHNFSFRGCHGLENALQVDFGHLLSFVGSDTMAGMGFVEEYYPENGTVIMQSVPATEHGTMTIKGPEGEFDCIETLITKTYPKGIISIVVDGYDYWNVIESYLPTLKPLIMARDGKVVVRPDSGDGVSTLVRTVEALWDIFGGTTNSLGYKELDSHIGVILGEGVTKARTIEIFEQLKALGFASTNVVLGVGSFLYCYVSRDTDGWACKATYAVINGVAHLMFKKPKTDDGLKTSAVGLIAVYEEDGTFVQRDSRDGITLDDVKSCAYVNVFENSKLLVTTSIGEIRQRLHGDGF